MTYLLDTNVVSELRRPRAAPQVAAWARSVPPGSAFISVLVLGEVRAGIERLRRRDPVQAAVYRDWLEELRQTFAHRTIQVDEEIAEDWGSLNATDPIATVDGLMAATARVRGMILVTRNVAHVARPGVRVLNPWEPPPPPPGG
jgi:predicted nucleic acid-binding protein